MPSDLGRALGQIPAGLFVLTAAYDGSRSGVLVKWVQQCALTPPMVMVAMARGVAVEPLIRDSRGFALCQISPEDRLLQRKFATAPGQRDDSFVSLATTAAPSGSPIIERAIGFLDCEVVRHIDLESDHGLYVGLVRGGGMLNSGKPAMLRREDGLVE